MCPSRAATDAAEEIDGIEVWLDSSFSISGFVVQKGTDGEQGVDGVMVMAMSMSPPGVLQAPLVSVKSLAVAGHQVDAPDVGVLHLPDDDVDGLLGMDYLSRFEFEIDQENSILRLVSTR